MIESCSTVLNAVLTPLWPFTVYKTLIADTKYWRGLGRHNKDGVGIVPRVASARDAGALGAAEAVRRSSEPSSTRSQIGLDVASDALQAAIQLATEHRLMIPATQLHMSGGAGAPPARRAARPPPCTRAPCCPRRR